MKTIIVPTDFSSASLNAVNYATDLACMLDANIMLFHVYSLPTVGDEVSLIKSYKDIEANIYNRMDELKNKLIDRVGKRILIHSKIKEGTSVLYELNFLCAMTKPYAVVMGPESMSIFERIVSEGKTVAAVKQLQWPVIIVPSCATFKNIHKIGLACDFRDVETTVRIKEIKNLLHEFNAELHVLHVSENSNEAFNSVTVEQSAKLHELLEGVKPTYNFITNTDIERGLTDYADTHNLDLLIIIPKQHNLLHKIFNYSHSKRLALHSHRPVMALHQPYYNSIN